METSEKSNTIHFDALSALVSLGFDKRAAEKALNRPYFGPGVITQRTDENDYSWLADPGRGNIIRSLGQPIN